jgi:bacterioferritin
MQRAMRTLRADHQAHHGRGAGRRRLRGGLLQLSPARRPGRSERLTAPAVPPRPFACAQILVKNPSKLAWRILRPRAQARWLQIESPSRFGILFAHDLFRKPVSTFRDHALEECRAMKGDPKVIEYLNKGLRSELTAVSQYWLHYRLLDNWGYRELAKKWRKESIEEMEHADKFTTRIIFLEGFPNMQVLDPLHIGQTIKEVLDCDLQAEIGARTLYQEAATYCQAAKDYVSRDLFEELMKDEEGHIDFLETQLDLVAKLGLELYAQHHIGELDEGD